MLHLVRDHLFRLFRLFMQMQMAAQRFNIRPGAFYYTDMLHMRI